MNKPHRFLVALALALPTYAVADFSGVWHIDFPNRNAIASISDEFNVYLIQQGNTVCGFHYGTARQREKVDWGWKDERKPTVYGKLDDSGTTLTVSLVSAHNNVPIEATITDNGDQLAWNVTNTEQAFAMTIPHSVALRRAAPRGFEFRRLTSCDEDSPAVAAR